MSLRISATLAQPGPAVRPGWSRLALPADLGECVADRLDLGEGLALVHSQYTPVRDLIEENAAAHGGRTLVITLALGGVSAYRGADGAALDFRGGQTTVTAFRRHLGERRYLGGCTVSQLRLLVGEAALRRYAGEARAEALFPLFGLAGYENAWPGDLSGGMRQRAAFLRTALCDADILLLDEPFGALDVISRGDMQDWLVSMKQHLGRTCLLVTHDIDEAIFLSDRILVLGGRPADIRSEYRVVEAHRTRDWLYSQGELRHRLHDSIRGLEARPC